MTRKPNKESEHGRDAQMCIRDRSGKVVRSTASETIELSGDPMLPTGPDVMLPEEVSGPLRKKM